MIFNDPIKPLLPIWWENDTMFRSPPKRHLIAWLKWHLVILPRTKRQVEEYRRQTLAELADSANGDELMRRMQ